MLSIEWIILAAAALAAAAAGVWRLRRAAGTGGRGFERRAAELSWEYDSTVSGDTLFALRGETSGVRWKVRCRADATRPDAPLTLTWKTRSVQGSATELRLVGRARYERGRTSVEPVFDKLSSLVLSPRDIALAQQRAEFVERTPPVEVGSAGFRERFVVIARNHRLARALFDKKTEGLLAAWPDPEIEKRISIWLDWQGLRIDLETPHARMREIEQLVSFGLALASRYRRHAASPRVTQFMETQPGGAR